MVFLSSRSRPSPPIRNQYLLTPNPPSFQSQITILTLRDFNFTLRTQKLIELMSQRGREGSIRLLIDSLKKMSVGDAADAIGCVLVSFYQVNYPF